MSDAEENGKEHRQQERQREGAQPQQQHALETPTLAEPQAPVSGQLQHPLHALQAQAGNRALARAFSARPTGTARERPEVGAAGGRVSNRLATRIYQSLGQGARLDPAQQASLEAAYGATLDDVRVHTGAEADGLTRQVSARAFTLGRDIFFSREAGPGDSRLLAHEVAHVVQQEGAPAPGVDLVVGPAGDALEHEADRAASESAGVTLAPAAPQVQRDFWDEMNLGNLSGIAGMGSSLVQGGIEAGVRPLAELAGTTAPQMASVPGGVSALGGLASVAGLYTGGRDMLDEDKPWYERVVGGMSAAGGATGLASTISGMFGSSLFAAGGSAGLTAGAGSALTGGGAGLLTGAGAATALGSAGAVLGAGAAGYGAGRLLDEGVGSLGQWITGDEQGDYTISGGLASGMTAVDQGLTSLWADPDRPAYTQTIGWQLGELLGI